MDRNRKHNLKIAAAIQAGAIAIPVTAGTLTYANDAHGAAVLLITMLSMLPAGLMGIVGYVFVSEMPTRSLPTGTDRRSFTIMVERLASISRSGLSPAERLHAQREIDAADEQLRHMLGKETWVSVAGLPSKPAEPNMRLRSEALSSNTEITRWSAAKHGVFEYGLRTRLALLLPTIVAVIRDFGLDPKGFAPSTRRLPGQDLDHPTAIPLMAAPARTLAAEWLDGDNGSVPTVDRMDADKAATTELDALESAWAQARTTADAAQVDDVDASFQRGLDRISARLSAAIMLRARTDRDVLETNVRYLDVKHQE